MANANTILIMGGFQRSDWLRRLHHKSNREMHDTEKTNNNWIVSECRNELGERSQTTNCLDSDMIPNYTSNVKITIFVNVLQNIFVGPKGFRLILRIFFMHNDVDILVNWFLHSVNRRRDLATSTNMFISSTKFNHVKWIKATVVSQDQKNDTNKSYNNDAIINIACTYAGACADTDYFILTVMLR